MGNPTQEFLDIMADAMTFDEPCLEIISKQKVQKRKDSDETGGPEKWVDNRRY